MALTTATSLSNLVTRAYDLAAWPALRPNLIFDQFATVKSTNQSHNGSSVRFSFVGDLAPQTTPLTESSDITPVALTQSFVDVTLAEYGAAVTTTGLVRGTAYVPVDPVAAERVGFNAGISIDTLVESILAAGTNTTDISVTAGYGSNNMSSGLLRATDALLAGRNVQPWGQNYALVIHPDVEFDLRSETDAAGWRYFQANNSDATAGGGSVFEGNVGRYENFQVITNNRVTTSGSGESTKYTSYAMGREALAKAHSRMPGYGPFPHVGPSPVVDIAMRFVPVHWYWLGGYAIFRQEALQVITTESSIND